MSFELRLKRGQRDQPGALSTRFGVAPLMAWQPPAVVVPGSERQVGSQHFLSSLATLPIILNSLL